MSYSQDISRFIAGLRFEDLPGPVIESAKRHLLDIVGVGLAGSRQDVACRMLAAVERMPGTAGSTRVWGRKARLSALHAAMVNGVSAHVQDFDDTHTDSITHGSAVLGPAVMALAEELDAPGTEVITAFVAGWEVVARVGIAARGSFHKRGFHTTSVAGIFGATAVAGRLLGLSEEQLSHAFGLAGSQVSGVSEYLSNGSSSKSFHAGWAAHAGIVAAHLAKSGMTGPMTVFEGRYGTYRSYGLLEECDLTALNAGLGKQWETTGISIKPYPCCHFAHAFIDCAKELRRRGIRPQDVELLECIVPEIELPLICEPYPKKLRPESPYEAKFSLPFLVAVALTDGAVDHDTFSSRNILRSDLLALADRVTYRTAQVGETTFPRYFPGHIQGTLKDGRKIEQRLDINYGNPDNPLSDADVEGKFRINVKGILDEEAAAGVIAALQHLERLRAGDVACLLG